jgi:hypothetical protein
MGEIRNAFRISVRIPEGKNYAYMMILKWILNKQDGRGVDWILG